MQFKQSYTQHFNSHFPGQPG